MRLSLAICDDDPVTLRYLAEKAAGWGAERGHVLSIFPCPSAEALLFAMEDRGGWDILLLDIEMPGMDGMTLSKRLRARDKSLVIVFITGYPEYMQEGYDVGALHYLLKPVREEKLFEVLDRAAELKEEAPPALYLSSGRESEKILLRDVLYAESDGHYVRLHTAGGEKRFRATVPEAEKLLGKDFFRVSRSYLVPLARVKTVSRNDVTLDDGTALPLGKGICDQLNRALIAYFRRDRHDAT